MAFKTTTAGLNTYLKSTSDALILLVHQHEENKKLYPIAKEAKKFKN
jgi:hypothetical protein